MSYSATRHPSPYTPHILALLIVSFPLLVFIISLPSFPIRGVCLIGGLLPVFLTHPWMRTVGVFVLQTLITQGIPIVRRRIEVAWKVRSFWKLWFEGARQTDKESIGEGLPDVNPIMTMKTFLQRVMDDDRLSDSCWNSEMREVELWENERFGGRFYFSFTSCVIWLTSIGSDPAPHSTSPIAESDSIPASASASTVPIPVSSSSLLVAPQKGWSKQNLKNGERRAWTRGRDGWSPVVGSSAGNVGASTNGKGSGMVEGNGEIRFVFPQNLLKKIRN